MIKSKKVMHYLIFLLMIVITSIITIAVINHKSNKKSFKYERLPVELEQGSMPIVKTKKALSICYNEDEVASFFSSISLFRDPYLYDLYWSYKILEQTGDVEKFKDELSNLTMSCESSLVYENERMEVISNIVELQVKLGLDIRRKDEIIEVLNSRFLEKEKLFHDVSENTESIEEKIYATMYAVLITKSLKIEENFDIKGIYKVITNEYYNELNFSNDFDESVVGIGSAIFKFIYVHNINLDDFNPEINDRNLKWIENLNNNYMENINESYDYRSVIKLRDLLEMNKCIKNEFSIEDELIDRYLDSQNFIGGFGPYRTNIDTISTYDMISLCTLNNSEYKNTQGLVDFIEKQINAEFLILGDSPVSMLDNYYGISLANATGFEYNTEMASEFIKLNYLSYIGDDYIINDFDKMRDIYYILLSCKEMDIDIEDKDKDKLVRSVTSFLETQDFNADADSVLRNFRMGLELSMLCDKNLSDKYSEKIEELIKLTISSNSHEDLLALYEMVKLLEYTGIRNENYDEIVSKTIKNLYCDGGFKLYNSTKADSHIYYLAKGIYIMKYAKSLSAEVVFEVRTYLNDFTGSEFAFSENDPIELRTIYQGYLASKYISEYESER